MILEDIGNHLSGLPIPLSQRASTITDDLNSIFIDQCSMINDQSGNATWYVVVTTPSSVYDRGHNQWH